MFTTTLKPTTGSQSQTFPDDLFAAIEALKQELNAVILAHYYQDPYWRLSRFIPTSRPNQRGCDCVCRSSFYGRNG